MKNIGIRQILIHRQQKASREEALCERQALGKAQPLHLVHRCSAPLQNCADAVALQMTTQSIAIANIYFVILVNVKVSRPFVRPWRSSEVRQSIERCMIGSGDLPTPRERSWKVRELVVQNRRVEIVETAIGRPYGATIFELLCLVRSMVPHSEHKLGERSVRGGKTSTIAKPTEQLAWVEAERPEAAEGTGSNAIKGGSKGLRCVFEHEQSMSIGNRGDTIHVADPAVQLGNHDRPGSRGDGSCDRIRIDHPVCLHFDRHWRRTREVHGLSSGDKGVRADDDFVPAANSQCADPKLHRVGTIRSAYGKLRAHVSGETLFKAGYGSLQDDTASCQRRPHHLGEAGRVLSKHRLEIEKRNSARRILRKWLGGHFRLARRPFSYPTYSIEDASQLMLPRERNKCK